MFKHILVPTDGSKFSNLAARNATRLARALGARITAVIVVPTYEAGLDDDGFLMPNVASLRKRFEVEAAASADRILGAIREAATGAGVECKTVVASGNRPYEAIIKIAKASRCDLIMMASHGRKGLEGLLLGSETQKVLTHSRIPVLVYRK